METKHINRHMSERVKTNALKENGSDTWWLFHDNVNVFICRGIRKCFAYRPRWAQLPNTLLDILLELDGLETILVVLVDGDGPELELIGINGTKSHRLLRLDQLLEVADGLAIL